MHGCGEGFLHDAEDHGIGHEIAAIHAGLGFATEGRPRLEGGTEHIPGRDLGDAECRGYALTLRPLAGTRRAQQYNDHAVRLRNRSGRGRGTERGPSS